MSGLGDAVELDARGLRCPWPALRLARLMRDHAHVVILTDDPAAPGELRALATARDWEVDTLAGESDTLAIRRI